MGTSYRRAPHSGREPRPAGARRPAYRRFSRHECWLAPTLQTYDQYVGAVREPPLRGGVGYTPDLSQWVDQDDRAPARQSTRQAFCTAEQVYPTVVQA